MTMLETTDGLYDTLKAYYPKEIAYLTLQASPDAQRPFVWLETPLVIKSYYESLTIAGFYVSHMMERVTVYYYNHELVNPADTIEPYSYEVANLPVDTQRLLYKHLLDGTSLRPLRQPPAPFEVMF